MFADKIQYRQYERMLVDLHLLIRDGKDSSDEANELRELMEIPEQRLTESEIIRLNALSGDLSLIHGHEIPDEDVQAAVKGSPLPDLLIEAYRQKDWEEVLRLLRADVSFLRPDRIASMRARAYQELKEWAPAIAFFDEAAKLNPGKGNSQAIAMELLWEDDRVDEAYARAKSYLADPTVPERLVLMSAGILSQLAMGDSPPADLPSIVQRAIPRIARALSVETLDSVRVNARVSLGLLSEYVDDNGAAVSAWNEAADEGEYLAPQAYLLLMRGLDFAAKGESKSPASRQLSRRLAGISAPSRVLVLAMQ